VKTETANHPFLGVLTGHRQWVSVKETCDRLKNAGFDAVLAGGCVRDGLLGVSPKDFDIATSATPDQVEALFEKSIAIGKLFGVIAIPLENGDSIEIATFRRDGGYADGRHPSNIEFSDRSEDAKRRDFTVNALFYDPSSNLIFDEVGGLEDLKNQILRVVGDPEKRFDEDKLRLLRAVRFVGQLGFSLEPLTASAVKTFAKSLNSVSRERIRDEVDKLLAANESERGFSELDRLGLAKPVFDDWSNWIFPVAKNVFSSKSLEVRRALLFYPAFSRTSPDRILDRLKGWKYGRSFCDLVAWTVKNENALRAPGPDLRRHLKSRDDLIRDFQIGVEEEKRFTMTDREWMSALELWTDERAERACAILDALKGEDPHRSKALASRGVELGKTDPARAKASDLLAKPEAKNLEGAHLGRELRRLNREILLR
jgi:poly(A) polymerase